MPYPRAHLRGTPEPDAPAPRRAQLESGEVLEFPGGLADDEMDRRVKEIVQFRRANKGRFPDHLLASWEKPPPPVPYESIPSRFKRGFEQGEFRGQGRAVEELAPPIQEQGVPEFMGAMGRRAYEGVKGAVTMPLEDLFFTGNLYKLLTPDRPGEHPVLRALKRAIPEGIGAVERVFLYAPFNAIAEAAGGVGDQPGTRQMWYTLLNAGLLLRGAHGAPEPMRQTYGPRFKPEPPRARFRQPRALPPGQEPLALPAGPEVRALPGQVGQRALSPPGPEDAEFTVQGETRTAVPDPMAGEGWRRTPGPMISPRRPPRARAAPPYQRALPPPREGLQFGGPLDPSAPLPEVDVRPPAPPLGPAGRVMPTAPERSPAAPRPTMGLPPMLEPPSSIPKAPERLPQGHWSRDSQGRRRWFQPTPEGAEWLDSPPKASAKTPRASTGKTKYQHVDLGTVNLSDPDEVRSLIEGLGGIRKADIEGIPFWMRGKDGVDFDVLVSNIAKEQKRPHKEIERQLGHTLKRYDQLRVDKRAKDAGKPKIESWETDVPDWVTDENLWREE